MARRASTSWAKPKVRQFVAEGLFVHRQVHRLTADDRRGEGDLEGHFKALGRQQARALVAVDHLDGGEDLDIAARRLLTAATGLVQDLDEGLGRAVHDRHFGSVELDHGVVDAEHGEGRHQVLDGGDGDAGGVTDDGAELGLADRLARDGHAIVAVGHVGPDEDDAGVGRRRANRHPDMRAGMDADARKDGRAKDGMLAGDDGVGCGHGDNLLHELEARTFSDDRELPHRPDSRSAAAPQSTSCFRMFRVNWTMKARTISAA